jgi:hypothetical protein
MLRAKGRIGTNELTLNSSQTSKREYRDVLGFLRRGVVQKLAAITIEESYHLALDVYMPNWHIFRNG